MVDADYALVRRSIKVLLTPENMDERPALPATYDRIARACRAVVAEAGRGEGLYDVVKMELERCVGTIEKRLVTASEKSVEWLKPFTESCGWFEQQVVSIAALTHVKFKRDIHGAEPAAVLACVPRHTLCGGEDKPCQDQVRLSSIILSPMSSHHCRDLAYAMFTTTVIKSARVSHAVIDGLADWLEDERVKR